MGNHPDIVVLVDSNPIVIICIQGTLNIVVLPYYPTLWSIEANQFTVCADEDHALFGLRIGRDAKFLRELIITVAELQMLKIL